MKKFALVFILSFVICLGALAQDITRSPFEGAWVWDGQGEDPGISELIFFGNVMLMMESYDYNEYSGSEFSFSDSAIKTANGNIDWQYQISGTRLTITVFYEDQFTFVKTDERRSPIEGIWKLTGGTDVDPEYDSLYILFTRDLMAVMYYENWHGINVIFRGNYIYPDPEEDEDDPLGFTISGDILILHDEEEELIMTRLY